MENYKLIISTLCALLLAVPVYADTLAGNSTSSVDEDYLDVNRVYSDQFTAIASGTLENGYVQWGSTDASCTSQMGVWDSSNNLMDISNEITGITDGSYTEYTFDDGDAITSGQTYRIGVANSASKKLRNDNVGSSDYDSFTYSSGNMPDPWGTSGSWSYGILNAYVTGAVSSPATTPNKRASQVILIGG